MTYWLINALCGLALLFLLGAHMLGFHLDDLLSLITGGSRDPLAWSQVSQRGASPFYAAFYIVMLGTALFHGFYGLDTVLTEVWSGRRAKRLIRVACWSAGVVLFTAGVVAASAFYLGQ